MANTIPNQPIIFDYSDDCLLASDNLKVMAQYGDITQFQMELEPCGADVNLIQGGNFQNAALWTSTSSAWEVSSGNAIKVGGVSGQLYQAAPTTNGTLARLTFTIVSITGGSLNVSWAGNTHFFDTAGTYTLWLTADAATNLSFAANASTYVWLRDVQLITVNTDFQVNIIDEDGANVDTLETSDGYFDFSDGYFTCSIDWETLGISDGCYRLEVVDPCPCSQRGIIALDLTSGAFEWSTSASWTIGSGTASYSGTSSGTALLSNTLCVDTIYQVSYTISNITANAEVNIRLGNQNGTTRTANGSYTEQITCDGTGFKILGNSTSGTSSFDVTNLSIEIRSTPETITSNEIKLKENLDGCSLALAMCNDSDALGFGFANTGFRPLMRIPASLNRSSYVMERLSYDNSRGRKATYYGRRRKALELGYDGKYFMHDFASLFGLADHFYIDDVEYFVEDDEYPSISWGEFDDVGGVTVNVSEKVQLVENRRLSSATVGCEPEGSVLLGSDDEPIYDSQQDRITTP